jgi:HEPN domain-containing protein
VDNNKRKTIVGWIEKASNHLDTAKEHMKSAYCVSDSIQASQVCVELSVKAILMLLEIPYQLSHGWNRKELAEIAKHIKDRDLLSRLDAEGLGYTVPLPRLLFRANFWSQFYLEAKYGFEAEHLAPAQELFEKEDADLAANHADACLRAARYLLYLPEEKRAALTV